MKKLWKKSEGRLEVLNIGDNVIINNKQYRIQEEPIGQKFYAVDVQNKEAYLELFHEDDVQECLIPKYWGG